MDWITGNIYFAESAARMINVCNANGTYRSSLISSGLGSPRGMAIDPRDGYAIKFVSFYLIYFGN